MPTEPVLAPLFTIEGLDATGKSDLVKRLRIRCDQAGLPVFFTADPSPHGFWPVLKAGLLERRDGAVDNTAKAFLFLAARCEEAKQRILPRLAAGVPVVSDRYCDSWVAYQAAANLERFQSIEGAVEFFLNRHRELVQLGVLPHPTRTYYIADEPGSVMDRILNAADRPDGPTVYENIETQRRVQQAYRALIQTEPGRFLVFPLMADDLAAALAKAEDAILADIFGAVGAARMERNVPP